MIVIVGLGIALVLVLFFSAIVDRIIIGAFGAVVLLGGTFTARRNKTYTTINIIK